MPVPVKFIGEHVEGSSEPRTWEILTEVVPKSGEHVMFDDLQGHRTYAVRQVMYWYLWKPSLNQYGLVVEVHMDMLREYEDKDVRWVESH